MNEPCETTKPHDWVSRVKCAMMSTCVMLCMCSCDVHMGMCDVNMGACDAHMGACDVYIKRSSQLHTHSSAAPTSSKWIVSLQRALCPRAEQ